MRKKDYRSGAERLNDIMSVCEDKSMMEVETSEVIDALASVRADVFLDDSLGCSENLVNEINIVSPDVIASFLPSPSQEKFLLHNREKLLMNLWYGIGNNKFMGKKHGFIGKIRKMLDVKRLTHLINTYEHRQNSSI